MPKFYPVPPRNPALDPFRGRKWSEAAFSIPTLRALPRKFTRRGRVFVITRDTRNFLVVASDAIAADNRVSILYP